MSCVPELIVTLLHFIWANTVKKILSTAVIMGGFAATTLAADSVVGKVDEATMRGGVSVSRVSNPLTYASPAGRERVKSLTSYQVDNSYKF